VPPQACPGVVGDGIIHRVDRHLLQGDPRAAAGEPEMDDSRDVAIGQRD
jgi:hypothetical protein